MKKKVLAFILYYSGIVWLKLLWMRIFSSKKLRILAYHRVLDIDPEKFEFDDNLVDVTVSDFDKQMRFVSKYFNVITFKDFIAFKKTGKFPKNPLIITFDDGYKDNYTNAYPLLKKYGLKAVIFLATDYIDTKEIFWWDKVAYAIKKTQKKEIEININGGKYRLDLSTARGKKISIAQILKLFKTIDESKKREVLTALKESLITEIKRGTEGNDCLSWEDIREMSEYGIEFGAHTCSHSILTNLSNTQMKEEIFSSKTLLEKRLTQQVISFAYPNGYFNNECKKIVKEAGFSVACSYSCGINDLSSMDMYALNRISVDINTSPIVFKTALIFTRIMSVRSKVPPLEEYQWISYSTSKKSLKLFLELNKAYSKRLRLSYILLKLPFVGFPLVKKICSNYIAFVENGAQLSERYGSLFTIIEEFVKNNTTRLLEESEKSLKDTAFLVFEHRRGINIHLISNSKILLFIKYIKHKRLEYWLEKEYENIIYLNSRLTGNLVGSIPRLCLLENINGHLVLFLNYMTGEVMSESLSYQRPKKHLETETNILKVLRWLVEFQRQTETSKVEISFVQRKLKSLLLQYEAIKQDDSIVSFFNEDIMPEINKQEGSLIPLTCSHGDFFPRNILIAGDEIKVIDWPEMNKEEISTDDLFAFFLSLRLLPERGNHSDTIIESFKFIFAERNWFSTFVRDCLEWYCSEMKLKKGLLRILFPVYLLKQTVSEVNGTFDKKMVSPEGWERRLKYYVETRESFMLNLLGYAR